MTADELEQELTAEATQRQIAWLEEVQACAIYNGVSPEATRGYLESQGSNSTSTSLAGPVSDAERRSIIAEQGSGLVASLRDPSILTVVESGSSGLETEELRVLESGPIKAPETGLSYPQGCFGWATEEVEGSDKFAPGVAREQAYLNFLEDYSAATTDRQSLNSEWSRCMARAGLDSFEQPGDQLVEIREMRRQVRGGTMDFDQALSRDIQLTLTHYDCWLEVGGPDRNRAMGDAAVEAFLAQE